MWAWVHHETGDVAVLRLEELPAPSPGPGEILVRNRAIGLNPVDWKVILSGHPAWGWPHIPGVDGAGEIEAVGSGVQHIRPGVRVAYHTDLRQSGSFAEETVIPARAAIPLPDSLPFAAAAAIPCPWLTAVQAIDKVNLWPGAQILVVGASGAVGGALLQLARRRGWIIHAVCSAGQAARVMRLGAVTVTDYRDPGWIVGWRTRAAESPLHAVFDMSAAPMPQGLPRC